MTVDDKVDIEGNCGDSALRMNPGAQSTFIMIFCHLVGNGSLDLGVNGGSHSLVFSGP